jgi:hypothetical protein
MEKLVNECLHVMGVADALSLLVATWYFNSIAKER